MAQLHKNPYPMPTNKDWRLEFDLQGEEIARLRKTSAALPEGEIVGGLIKFQIADGYAHYLVTKASPLTVQWVPYCDNYQASAPTIRGLNKADIQQMLGWERKLDSLFGGKK